MNTPVRYVSSSSVLYTVLTERHAGTPPDRRFYLQFLFSPLQPSQTEHNFFEITPVLIRTGQVRGYFLAYSSAHRLPRRLIPFLPLAFMDPGFVSHPERCF